MEHGLGVSEQREGEGLGSQLRGSHVWDPNLGWKDGLRGPS